MPKFMNAELEAIRDNLKCGHCSSVFKGSDSQAWKVKYEKRITYCSTACRQAAFSKKVSKPIPSRGPCKTCGKEFFSRTSTKSYCSMGCYTKSKQFQDMLAENRKKITPESPELSAAIRARIADKQKKGRGVMCLECGGNYDGHAV